MTYATATDLLTRFDAEEIVQRCAREIPRLVSDEMLRTAAAGGDLGGYSEEEQAATARALDKLRHALEDARATVDGYLAGRYQLPLSPLPPVLVRIACELARYYLYDDQLTEPVKQRFEANVRFLRDVASGVLQLGADSETGATPAAATEVALHSAGRVWDRRGARGFV
jgi:phage gp36-like protein